MEIKKYLLILLAFISLPSFANDDMAPEFKNYQVNISNGSFANRLIITEEQKKHSNSWVQIMQNELRKKANFAGHYRLYLSQKGELPVDCGPNGWVCGWVIDKTTGSVISELPIFNGNSNYYSTIDNGTPSPDLFSIEFYPNSNLIWLNGENIPKSKLDNISFEDKKCANNAYVFKSNKFTISFVGECEIDYGSY